MIKTIILSLIIATTPMLDTDIPNNRDLTHDSVISMGTFKITYYNGDGSAMEGGNLNALGDRLKPSMIAVDPDVIPLGTKVIIDGKEYTACDVGGLIKDNTIDIYRDVSASELERLGVDYYNVYIIKEENNGF